MATKKYICTRTCYRRNPSNLFRLYELGETEWFDPDLDAPSPNHWKAMEVGEPLTALEALRMMCEEVDVKVDKDWDLSRLQREYDHKKDLLRKEQDKSVMSRTVAQPDADVHKKMELPKKGK